MTNVPLRDGQASDGRASFADADRRIAQALASLPVPGAPADLAGRVAARVARRRLVFRVGGLAAAAAALLLVSRLWLRQPELPATGSSAGPGQEALVAQWDALLDEAAALPPVVAELNILATQRAWIAALQDVQAGQPPKPVDR
jgi:hypothetical protein